MSVIILYKAVHYSKQMIFFDIDKSEIWNDLQVIR